MLRQRLNLIFAVLAVADAGTFGWLSLTASPAIVEDPVLAALVVEPGVATKWGLAAILRGT